MGGAPTPNWCHWFGPTAVSEKSKFQPQQPGQGAPIQCAPEHLNGRVHGGDVGAVMPIVGISLRQKTSRLWLPLFSFRAPSSLISAQLASLCAKRGVFSCWERKVQVEDVPEPTRRRGRRVPDALSFVMAMTAMTRKRTGWSGLFLVSSGGGCARRATPSFVGATSKH